jgi:hypothetical protein
VRRRPGGVRGRIAEDRGGGTAKEVRAEEADQVNWRCVGVLCLALPLAGCLKEQKRQLDQCVATHPVENGVPDYERGRHIRQCMMAVGYDFNPGYDFCDPTALDEGDLKYTCYRPIGAIDRYFTNAQVTWFWYH